jgi:hypothetical protein
MSTYGDNTIKQDVLDALEGCQYGYKLDDEGYEYVKIERPIKDVVAATLHVLADLNEFINDEA